MGKTWRYGDPAPKTWRDAADILKRAQREAEGAKGVSQIEKMLQKLNKKGGA